MMDKEDFEKVLKELEKKRIEIEKKNSNKEPEESELEEIVEQSDKNVKESEEETIDTEQLQEFMETSGRLAPTTLNPIGIVQRQPIRLEESAAMEPLSEEKEDRTMDYSKAFAKNYTEAVKNDYLDIVSRQEIVTQPERIDIRNMGTAPMLKKVNIINPELESFRERGKSEIDYLPKAPERIERDLPGTFKQKELKKAKFQDYEIR